MLQKVVSKWRARYPRVFVAVSACVCSASDTGPETERHVCLWPSCPGTCLWVSVGEWVCVSVCVRVCVYPHCYLWQIVMSRQTDAFPSVSLGADWESHEGVCERERGRERGRDEHRKCSVSSQTPTLFVFSPCSLYHCFLHFSFSNLSLSVLANQKR